jgi:hypothetical protein
MSKTDRSRDVSYSHPSMFASIVRKPRCSSSDEQGCSPAQVQTDTHFALQ